MRARERPGVVEKRERLADPAIRRWYDNLARGSEITASNYTRSLFAFCRRTGTTPTQLAAVSAKEGYRLLLDFVSAEEKRGVSGSAIVTYVKGVRSWLLFNGVKVEGRIKVRGAQQTPTLANEEVPTQEGLRRILLAATTQQRVGVALVAFSGVRMEVLGNYRGTDGLTVRDFPDLKIEGTKVTFTSLPARVVVRPELSKTSRQYFTHITAEGASYVSAYLEERMLGGEKIGPETDIFHPVVARKRFVKSVNISEAIRAAIDKAGFDFRPYNLRCYFDTQLLLAESKGKVAHDYRVFWMGHAGSMENRYTTNKGRLSKELVEDMRQAYHRAEAFLSTVPTGDEREEAKNELLADLAEAVEKATGKRADSTLTGDALAKAIRELLGANGLSPTSPVPPPVIPTGKPGEQKVVDAEAVDGFLGVGWTFKSPLNGTKAVVEWIGRSA